MNGFVANIADHAEGTDDFRRVLYTGSHIQLVLMSLKPGEDIGEEVHEDTDQFFRIEEGRGVVSIDGHETGIAADSAILVPAGARHNVTNTGDAPMKLYTLYGPPHHAVGTVHHAKAEAEGAVEHFTGETSESRGDVRP